MRFHRDETILPWGRVERRAQTVARPSFASDLRDWAGTDKGPRLAIGLSRSYGDTALFSAGRLIAMPALDRLIRFDETTGVLRAQSGLSLDQLLKVTVPRGWFVPVTPGTRHVTLGGALANDVHGKNHGRAGTFGRHVLAFSLLRSDSGVIEVTREDAPDLFAATIGGMGLTGVVLEVTLRMVPITSAYLDVETFPLGDLADFFALNTESLDRCEQTVAWIDCTKRGSKIGLGVYTRADWAREGGLDAHGDGAKTVPAEAPGFALNPASLSVFNTAYRVAQLMKPRRSRAHYSAFFHPLDSLKDWNKLYGPSGFYQYQCVVPRAGGREAIGEILEIIGRSGEGSALVVFKTFGDLPSPGLMSFPRAGYTLALDFRNRGELTLNLLARLDGVVREAGGALYPAKDGRMSRAMFELSYPGYAHFLSFRDPACGSDFLARLGL